MSDSPASPARVYERGDEEFGRVIALSDGIFAIAMTLLVLSISVPVIQDASSVGALARALDENSESFVSFFVSFAVIGRYWFAHHRFVALLRAMDQRLVMLTLVFLGLIAFLPFPTDLLGTYFENPLSVVFYAVAVGCVSTLEVVLFWHAHRRGLMHRRLPDDVFGWATFASLSPVAFFVASIPVAFLDTTAAVLLWFGSVPLGVLGDRRKPPRTDEYLGA